MNDEETVALIAGGHTFGKTHGAAPDSNLAPHPEGSPLEEQGLGYRNSFGTGNGDDTITSGLEVTRTYHPARWDNEYFHILFASEWELMESPAGAMQWRPKNGAGSDLVPLAHDASQHREPRMLTSDIALRVDPA
jgi:catalase-peroxidase